MWLGGRTEDYRHLAFQEANLNWVDGSPFNYSNFPPHDKFRQSGNVLTFVNSFDYHGDDSCNAQGCWIMHNKWMMTLNAVCQGITNIT